MLLLIVFFNLPIPLFRFYFNLVICLELVLKCLIYIDPFMFVPVYFLSPVYFY